MKTLTKENYLKRCNFDQVLNITVGFVTMWKLKVHFKDSILSFRYLNVMTTLDCKFSETLCLQHNFFRKKGKGLRLHKSRHGEDNKISWKNIYPWCGQVEPVYDKVHHVRMLLSTSLRWTLSPLLAPTTGLVDVGPFILLLFISSVHTVIFISNTYMMSSFMSLLK